MKYIHLKSKLWKYVNNKSWASFFYILQWQKNQKDSVNFWHRKMTLKVRIVKSQKYFYGCFHSFHRSCLFTSKLSCLQKNNFGHTKLQVLQYKFHSNHGVFWVKYLQENLRDSILYILKFSMGPNSEYFLWLLMLSLQLRGI